MSRPADWHPLAASDPVPGDPHKVSTRAKYYRDTATEIQDQARSLRRISRASWDSDAGRVFAKEGEEAATRLDQVVHRYEVVGSRLDRWVSPLESAQSKSLSLLADARDADRRMRENAPLPAVASAPLPKTATPQQAAAASAAQEAAALAASRRAAAYRQAVEDLARARRQLRAVEEERDERARDLAKEIKDAAEHDGLKDGAFQKFKAWVKENAATLKTVVKILGAIAFAVAIIGLIFSGVGFIAVLGLAIAFLQVVVGSMLAVAGEGSWFDVAFAALEILLVFKAAKILKGATFATRKATSTAARAASKSAQAQARAAQGAVRAKTAGSGKQVGLAQLRQAQKDAGRRAAARLRYAVTRPGGKYEQIVGRVVTGDETIWKLSRKLNLIAKRYPNNLRVLEAVEEARRSMLLPRTLIQGKYYVDIAQAGNSIREDMNLGPKVPDLRIEVGSRW